MFNFNIWLVAVLRKIRIILFSLFSDIPNDLFKIQIKLFEKIVQNLVEQEKWKRIYELVTKHNIEHGTTSLPVFASKIRTEILISQLIKDFPSDKSSTFIEEIVHCFIKNGGTVEPGEFAQVINTCNVKIYKILILSGNIIHENFLIV